MSAIFLWISHPPNLTPFENKKMVDILSTWVPFAPEKTTFWTHHLGTISSITWETHQEGARGSFHATNSSNSVAVSFTGWWREPDQAPNHRSSAHNMLNALCGKKYQYSSSQCERGLAQFVPMSGWDQPASLHHFNIKAWEALHITPGQFSAVSADQTGRLHGLNGAFGGIPIYYSKTKLYHNGQMVPVTIISNRALLISVFTGDGTPGLPRPESLAWLLAKHEQPLGDPLSAWSNIYRLHSGQRLIADEGEYSIQNCPLPHSQSFSYQSLYDELLWRTTYLKKLPQVPLSMALTGGFDSRLVLGALIATKQLNRVERYFINADPGHVETQVAQSLADQYQLEFNIDLPGRWQDYEEPILQRLKRHNLLVEYMCNAWDIQSGPSGGSLPRYGHLGGHFGEIYRSHFKTILSHSKFLLRYIYPSHTYQDRHKLLSKAMLDYCQKKSSSWIKTQFAKGMHQHQIFDEIHRYARMEGWATQNQSVEGLGFPSLSLLPCVSTKAHFESLYLSDQRQPTIHFELIRMVDDQLWRLPFANKSWPVNLHQKTHPTRIRSISGPIHHFGAQLRMWSKQGKNICTFLLDTPSKSSFWLVIDRQKLEHKIQDISHQVTAKKIKALMTAAAIKLALSQNLEPINLHRSL